MSVAVYINNASEAHALVSWGIRFAQADFAKLLIVVPRRQKQEVAKFDPLTLDERDNNELFKAVFESLDRHSTDHVVLKEKIAAGYASSDHDRTLVETLELIASNPEDAFVQNVSELEVKTLVLPAAQNMNASPSQAGWAQQLYETVPCEAIMVRGAPPERALNVLVVSNRDTGADVALGRACALAAAPYAGHLEQSEQANSAAKTVEKTDEKTDEVSQEKGKVEFLFVRPDDDEVALQVAEMHTKKILAKVGSRGSAIVPEIVLNDSLMSVVEKRDNSTVDLILMGTRHHKSIRGLFRHTPSKGDAPIALATMRPAVPLGNRLQHNMRVAVRRVVPQLEKEDRVRLVDRLQEGSSFNFDFAALISLSTIIAAMGLLDDSAAVVIGAMLVAPLMTPLVGIGFALIQGNERLMRTALWAVLYGFAVALLIGATLGLFVFLFSDLTISAQMLQRDSPGLLDLFVALFSGIAGAYAMSRKNLISALPGVAIAAALVPPIATAGMALTMGDFWLGSGALLLFFTNIVAIVLGTAVTFWAVGINTRLVKRTDGSHERPPRMWPRYWFAGFVLLSFLLAMEIHYFEWPKTKKKIDPVVPAKVEAEE